MSSAETPGQNNEEFKPDEGVESLSDMPSFEEHIRAKREREAQFGDHPVGDSTPDFEPTTAQEAFGSMGISVEETASDTAPDFEPTTAQEAFGSMGISVEEEPSEPTPDFEPKSASEAFDSMGISVEEEKSGDQ